MDFSKYIADFVSGQIGGILIIEKNSGRLVYMDDYVAGLYPALSLGDDLSTSLAWMADAPECGYELIEWEVVDSGRYLMLHSALFKHEEIEYQIYRISDNTLFVDINKDVSSYMSFFKKLSAFQSSVLNSLTGSPYELMRLVSEYLHFPKIVIVLNRDDLVELFSYDTKLSNDIDKRFEYKRMLSFEKTDMYIGEATDNLKLFVSGVVDTKCYDLYLAVEDGAEYVNNSAVKSILSLCVQNGIMREQILYNSEHDTLTGLFNKGKYMANVDKIYGGLDSIGIINLDVNNLKFINDNYGHEAGDKLIIKAADSIRAVSSNCVQCYRIGGDEFLIVCCNLSEKEVLDVKAKWEDELARLNTIEDGICCIVASGLAYAHAPYDFESLAKKADEQMYIDKKNKKEKQCNDNNSK